MAVTLLPRKGYTFFAHKTDAVNDCIPTTADILGPFYRAGAPMRSDLRILGDPGVPFIFRGKITDEQCNPLHGARVDVWHADNDGVYDNTTPAFRYRGVVETDPNGAYSFTSIIPGKYLNGSVYRPVHIHYRITAPGFTELITQLYFTGDMDIPTDPWASAPAAAQRIVPIDTGSGTATAVFDVALSGVLGIDELQTQAEVVVSRETGGETRISLPNRIIEHAEVFDMAGRLMATKYDINAGTVVFSLPPGQAYFVRLQTAQRILVHKFVSM